jgi:predicted DNA-binding transcriptional regulator YafY
LFSDRDRWYLVGKKSGSAEHERLWRADRVELLKARTVPTEDGQEFDVRKLLGRAWLRKAMADWNHESPVRIRVSRKQAERLRQDWYYQYASYEDLPDGQVVVTFGEDNRDAVLELVRWLGPGAELLAPEEWRAVLKAELEQMIVGLTPSPPRHSSA